MTKIAVSSGDPAGVGPDICIKAFGSRSIQPYFPVIFGNIGLFKDRAKLLEIDACLLYTSPSPRDVEESRMPSSA